MIRYKVLQLLFLTSSMTFQVIGMLPPQKVKRVKKVGNLPKELQHEITSYLLELQENPKYEVYKKLNVGSPVTGIVLTTDNTRAFTGSADKIARLWDVEKEEIIKEFKGHTLNITSVALSADWKIALTGSLDRTVRIWNMNTGELLKTLQIGTRVTSVALSADGSIALIGSDDYSARLYNAFTGDLIQELQDHKHIIKSVALSSNGTIALTGSLDKTVRVWNALTGKLITVLQIGAPVTLVALSVEGTTAVVVTTEQKVLIVDLETGALLNTLITAGVGSVRSVALSKDRKRVLTGTDHNTIQVWNTKPLPGVKETRIPLTVLVRHRAAVTGLAFGGDDFIASGSDDNTALIWKPFSLHYYWPLEQKKAAFQAFKEAFYNPEPS